MISTILFPTDLGLYSPFLLQHVIQMAEGYDADVHVVHAVEPLGVFADAVLETYVPVDMIGDLRVHGMPAVMDAIRQQVYDAFEDEFIDTTIGMSRIADIRVIRGTPAEVILEEIEISGCDVVLMGSHGHNSGHNAMLGSVVSKVLQLSRVPVMMVPMAQPRIPQLHHERSARL